MLRIRMPCFPNQRLPWLVWHSNPLWNKVSEVLNMFTPGVTDTYRYASLPRRNKNASVKPFCWHLTLLCQTTGSSVCSCFGVILTGRKSLMQMLARCHALSCVTPAHTKFVQPIVPLAVDWSLVRRASAWSHTEVPDIPARWEELRSPARLSSGRQDAHACLSARWRSGGKNRQGAAPL